MSTPEGEKGMSSRLRRVIWASLLPALIAGGIAFAASGTVGKSGGSKASGANGNGDTTRAAFPGPPPGPHPFDGNLTYAELHVQRNGKEVVVRLDRGKVKSTSSDSVTITENDGSDVTIPVDDQTRVFAGFAKRNASVSDLKQGQLVTVDREEGKPARVIAVMPKFRRFGGRRLGPPPGGMPWRERGGTSQQG
jgi:hypothetical protein